MKRALILSLLALGEIANAQTRRIAFEGTQSLTKLELKDIAPDFPSDWSRYKYLVLEMRTSTP